MANHPQPGEHDVSHDQDDEDLRSPISSAARSASAPAAAAIAAPAASAPAASVSAMSTVSASATATAAVHHDEIARVPGRRSAGATDRCAQNGHGPMQTAGARALWAPWFESRHHPIRVGGARALGQVPRPFPREARMASPGSAPRQGFLRRVYLTLERMDGSATEPRARSGATRIPRSAAASAPHRVEADHPAGGGFGVSDRPGSARLRWRRTPAPRGRGASFRASKQAPVLSRVWSPKRSRAERHPSDGSDRAGGSPAASGRLWRKREMGHRRPDQTSAVSSRCGWPRSRLLVRAGTGQRGSRGFNARGVSL